MSSVCNKSISFYSDAPEWGGQEILSARIASILAETNDVTFFFSCDKFADVLPANVKRVKLPFHSQTTTTSGNAISRRLKPPSPSCKVASDSSSPRKRMPHAY